MLELVRIGHGADRLHLAVGDVEREDASHPAFWVVGDRARLVVDQGRHGVGALLLGPAEQPEQEPGDRHRPVGRLTPGLTLATAVADHDHVRGKELEQTVQVTAADGVVEPAGDLVALLAGGLEPGLALVDVMPGAGEDLTAVRLGLAGDLGDLGVVVAEDLAEQEHGTFGGREAFQQDQEGHGQGIGHLGALRGVGFGRGGQFVGDERLGQPGAHVGLPPDPGGPQVADGQPGGDRGQVGLGRGDLGAVAERAGQPEIGLLHDILGVADAPGHPVGDREHQRPELHVVDDGLGLRRRCHGPPSRT
jgi:hypothetical protein